MACGAAPVRDFLIERARPLSLSRRVEVGDGQSAAELERSCAAVCSAHHQGVIDEIDRADEEFEGYLLELLAGGHLLGEQRRLDAVEDALQPADQLGLGDPQLGVGGRSGGLGVMRQFIGMIADDRTLHDLTLSLAAPPLRAARCGPSPAACCDRSAA